MKAPKGYLISMDATQTEKETAMTEQKTTEIIWDRNSDKPGWHARYNDAGNDDINHHDELLVSENVEEEESDLELLAAIAAPKGMTDEGGNLIGEVTFSR